jgi:hypothetical protein
MLECYGGEIIGGTDEKPESTKIAADWGSMTHEWKETGVIPVINGRKNLVPLLEKKIKLTGIDRERWWPKTMVHELAMAVSPFEDYKSLLDGTKEQKEAWKVAFSERYCTGTLDGYDWMFDVLWIDDLKTGKLVTEEDYVMQRKLYALGLSRLLDYRGPVNVTLTWWPRYPVLVDPIRFGRTVEQDELLAFEKRIAKLRDNVLRAKVDVKHLQLVPGEEQCSFCPSRHECPVAQKREYTYG